MQIARLVDRFVGRRQQSLCSAIVIAGLEILNLHAQGGMAEVYRARGKGADGTEYFYAVKRILPEYTRDPEIKKMFIEESRVAACLVHPSVVRVYDLATAENDELYIVMEFLEGKDLSEAIEVAEEKKQRLPIWFAIQIARETLRAMHYVTTEATDKSGRILGLIHRDISPHNIFVCFDGQVKLTDFGVAKVQESNVKTQVGITKGKLGYMSPEQLMGSPLDFRSDLYNVAILLFESITGRQLFAGGSTAEFLQAMVRGIVPPIPPNLQVPPDLEALIRRALDRDRTKRPATALEFEAELGQIAERYGLSAQAAHVAHQMRELYGRQPPPAALVKPMTAPQKLRSMMLAAVDAPTAAALAGLAPGTNSGFSRSQQQQQQQQQRKSPASAGYQSPYARPHTVGAPAAQPVADDDFATIVRPIEQVARPTPRIESRVAVASRPPSRPAAALPPEPTHQLQMAVSPRTRVLPSDPPPSGAAASPTPLAAEARSGIFATSNTTELTNPLAVLPSQSQSQSQSQRRPATVARGNARPLEALPSMPRPSSAPTTPAKKPTSTQHPSAPAAAPAWERASELANDMSDKTRIEPAPTARPQPPQPTGSPAPRMPTVQVGGSSIGVRSKRVVPLDDPTS